MEDRKRKSLGVTERFPTLWEVAATGLERYGETAEKSPIVGGRGTDSGTHAEDSTFADAVAAIMRLPLSDGEKADAVRRLLAERGTAR